MSDQGITERCYCGTVSMSTTRPPITVAFSHCSDCRRWTGNPAPAFAAFGPKDLSAEPALDAPVITNSGVERWNCKHCGSPLAATFEYIRDQIYTPLGLIDQADQLPAEIHCFSKKQLPGLHIMDDATRGIGSTCCALIGTTE